MKKTIIVVVLFHPTLIQIENKLTALKYNKIVFVDNTEHPDQKIIDLINSSTGAIYLNMGSNLGIATAQNKGIQEALKHKATHIVFFDQDSEIEPHYAETISNEYINLRKNGIKVGILGPIVKRFNKDEYKSNFHSYNVNNMGFIEKPDIISSGCVVDSFFINEVGGLDNTLFIDLVDFEWGWRAKSYNFKIGQTNKLCLTHKVGQEEFHLGPYQSIISSPFRYFFQCRNYIWLCKRKYVPRNYKFKTAFHILIHTVFYPLMVKKGWKIVKNMWSGICYGLKHKNIPNFSL